MSGIWKRLEEWLATHAVHLVQALHPPASQEEIEKVERTINAQLPTAYVDFLSVHNGQKRSAEYILDTEELLSTERIIEEWSIWRELLHGGDFAGIQSEPENGIKCDWWNLKWIPITYDGAGNHYCMDLDPAEGGHVGQIIRMWHDAPERELMAPSFEEWISTYVNMLEEGKYVYAQDWGAIVKKEDL
ncbi:MAG: SMI1/KNR4 family protein [Bacteroidota bacterium]